jgi:hypothetical protein
MRRTRKQALQYLLAGTLSIVLIGTVMLYPELAGIDGPLGYPFVIVLVGYLFVLASDHVRQSQYYPLIQAVFFLSWGGYNVSRGRVGLLTIILLVGGGSALLWGGIPAYTEGGARRLSGC